MANFMELASELRKQRAQEQADRQTSMARGGAATSSGGSVGGQMFTPSAQSVPQQKDVNVGSALIDGLRGYNSASGGARGPFYGATPSTMEAMASGGGSSLGTMGLMPNGPAVSFPGAPTGASAATGAGPAGWLALGAKALNDSGISSYGNTLKGQWAGNITDSIIGDRDKAGAIGNGLGAIGNFFGGDFGGSFDRAKSSLKDIFKLKFF